MFQATSKIAMVHTTSKIMPMQSKIAMQVKFAFQNA
jgi:hypothetical protein